MFNLFRYSMSDQSLRGSSMHVFHMCESLLRLYPWCSDPIPPRYAGANESANRSRGDIVEACIRSVS